MSNSKDETNILAQRSSILLVQKSIPSSLLVNVNLLLNENVLLNQDEDRQKRRETWQRRPCYSQGITASQSCALCHGNFHLNCKIILLLKLLNSAFTLTHIYHLTTSCFPLILLAPKYIHPFLFFM